MTTPAGWPTPTATKPLHGGVQHEFAFPNGYGASVVRHEFSYGGDVGLWELAVLGPDGHITYVTPITGNVLGYLSEDDVADALRDVAALPETRR